MTLPGGGIDFGEHPEAGAIRELREETGLAGRIEELLAVDSMFRPARPARRRATTTASASSTGRHIEGGTLTHETNESTDRGLADTFPELPHDPTRVDERAGRGLAYGERP